MNKKISFKSFDLNLISKYRTQLMGWGMLDVLLWHLCGAFGFAGITSQIFGTLTRFVFTPGFLFLSGFGLYYSFSKNSDVFLFYKRRLCRLMIPFSLMVMFVLTLQNLLLEEWDWAYYWGYITSVGFWIPSIGRHGCWYIALSLVLYAFYPIIHFWLFHSPSKVLSRTSWLVLLLIVCNILLAETAPDYYSRIDAAIPKIPMFVIGMYIGYSSQIVNEKRRSINMKKLVLYVVSFCIIAFLLKSKSIYIDQAYYIYDKLLFIPVVCMIFNFCERMCLPLWKVINGVFIWLGQYSLEIYVLHILFMQFIRTTHLISVEDFPWEFFIGVPLALLVCVPISKITKIVSSFIISRK